MQSQRLEKQIKKRERKNKLACFLAHGVCCVNATRDVMLCWWTYRGEWSPGQQSMMNELPQDMHDEINMNDIYPTIIQVPFTVI